MAKRIDFRFVGTQEVLALQKQNPEALTIAIGASKFHPVVSAKPREVDNYLELSPYDIFHGLMLEEGKKDEVIFEKGKELVLWLAEEVAERRVNPFSGLNRAQLPEKFFPYAIARAAYVEKVKLQLARAQVYLLNELFHVVTLVSTDKILSECYLKLPYNKVDFAIVYNPDWRKISIGANTRPQYLKGTASMTIFANLAEARELAQSQGVAYLRQRPTLDTISAALLLEGFNLPKLWLEYVESLTLGIFSGRLVKHLPSLLDAKQRLDETDLAKGWGGKEEFLGSANVKPGEAGTQHSIKSVLKILALTWATDEHPAKIRKTS